jgi:hypothetical protein
MKSSLTADGVLLKLQDYGIRYVVTEYSGSGDSGAIDTISFYNEHPDMYVNVEDDEYNIPTNAEEATLAPDEYTMLKNTIEDISYKILERGDVDDWYNNDGGSGTIILDTNTGDYLIDNTTYYTESNCQTLTGKFQSEE